MCFKIKITLCETLLYGWQADRLHNNYRWLDSSYIYIYIYSLKNKNVLVDIRKVTMVISERNLLNSDDVLLCSFTFTYGLKFIYRNTD